MAWPVQRSPLAPPVQVRTTPSQREFRSRDATLPRYLFTLSFEFLRGASALAEWQTLLGFFNQRGGDFEDFLFLDPADSTVTDQVFGSGTGVSTQFQLLRTLGGFNEPIYGLSGTPVLKANGVVIGSGYSIDNNGLVTFTAAPGVGATLTWTGTFCWRVRFAKGQLDFSQFMRDFWELKKVELLTVKPS
jgi:uncharacterized protein (TIGR02217 family)